MYIYLALFNVAPQVEVVTLVKAIVWAIILAWTFLI